MEFFSDLIRYGYLYNALAACILSGITCGVIGTYVVCRRMVFLAGGKAAVQLLRQRIVCCQALRHGAEQLPLFLGGVILLHG